MLISIEELKRVYTHIDFKNLSDELLERKLKAIETAIRKYTNNTFKKRAIREVYIAHENKLLCDIHNVMHNRFNVGDTVQISMNSYNSGLYVITEKDETSLTIDGVLIDDSANLVTLIEYPLDIVEGAISILNWDINGRDKVGIASESISRHSVSYVQYDTNNTINGYPSALFGFCKPYMRART